MKAAGALVLCLLVAGQAPAAPERRDCPGPRPGWATPRDGMPHLAMFNRITISRDNRLAWNREPVTRAMLRDYFDTLSEMRPLPFTILAPDPGVDCALLEAIRDDMAAALPCAEGACGEGRGRWSDGLGGRQAPPPGSQAESDFANAVAEIEAAADAAAADQPKR